MVSKRQGEQQWQQKHNSKSALENATFKINHSEDCLNALGDLLDADAVKELSERADINDIDDLSSVIWEILDNYVIYYADNWDYMKRYGDNDFKEPFAEGYTTISQLHFYYLEREVYDALSEAEKY